MNFLNKLERKYGRYAIENLSKYICFMYIAGAFLSYLAPEVYYNYLSLNPAMILRGQVWRVFTFLLMPPSTNIIFLIFVLYFYYSICVNLENVWGAFRFNMYYLVGVVGTVIGAFVLYLFIPSPYIVMGTTYINMSLFLAFAACFPDMQVMLYFIIPIKIKWLGYLDVILLVFAFVQTDLSGKISIIVAMLNFLLFFFATRNYHRISPKAMHRKKVYKRDVKQAAGVTRHQCAVCHRTELDDPSLEFRFCSKCEGNYEYCQEHLFSHTHVKK